MAGEYDPLRQIPRAAARVGLSTELVTENNGETNGNN